MENKEAEQSLLKDMEAADTLKQPVKTGISKPFIWRLFTGI